MLSYFKYSEAHIFIQIMSLKNIMTFMILPGKESHFRVRKDLHGLQQKVIRRRQCTTVWYARQVEDISRC